MLIQYGARTIHLKSKYWFIQRPKNFVILICTFCSIFCQWYIVCHHLWKLKSRWAHQHHWIAYLFWAKVVRNLFCLLIKRRMKQINPIVSITCMRIHPPNRWTFIVFYFIIPWKKYIICSYIISPYSLSQTPLSGSITRITSWYQTLAKTLPLTNSSSFISLALAPLCR